MVALLGAWPVFIGLTIMKTVGSMPSGITWSRGATPRVTWM